MALKKFPGLGKLDSISPLAQDANIKKMVNVEDPEEFNDSANKGYVDAGDLWEVSGSKTQLKTTRKVSNVVDPTADQDVATKKYVDDNVGGATTINIHPAAFQPEVYNGIFVVDESEISNQEGSTKQFVAHLSLPHGRTLSSAIGFGNDTDDGWVIYSLDSSGSATLLGEANMESSDTIAHTIDNTTYSYAAQIILRSGNDCYGLKITIT